jgi:adenylate cyclase class 2
MSCWAGSALSGLFRRSRARPDLPALVEIEGPDEASVRAAAGSLGLDYSQARVGSVDEIYMSELRRDILAERTLAFGSASE